MEGESSQVRFVAFLENGGLGEPFDIDNRDLDDLDLARVDFPELAWRHATGAPPLTRSYS